MARRTTLVVCESPWTDYSGRIASWSMRPFVEGICELSGTRLIYRTFATGEELMALLAGEAVESGLDGRSARVVLYIACHGKGDRLTIGRGRERVNLGTLARKMRKGIEGVWLGACEVGGAQSLQGFLVSSGAIWAGGYNCAVYWEPSMLLDIAVLTQLLSGQRISSRTEAIRAFRRALAGFDSDWIVGENETDSIVLANAVRIVARDKAPRSRPDDISQALLRKLHWIDSAA